MKKDIMIDLNTLIDDAIVYIDEVFGNLKATKDENGELNILAKHPVDIPMWRCLTIVLFLEIKNSNLNFFIGKGMAKRLSLENDVIDRFISSESALEASSISTWLGVLWAESNDANYYRMVVDKIIENLLEIYED